MSAIEKKVKQGFERIGYTVLTSGWPDFLLVKDGKIEFLEIKAKADKPNPRQVKMLRTLFEADLKVGIFKVNGEARFDGDGWEREHRRLFHDLLLKKVKKEMLFKETEFDGAGVS